MELKKMAIDGFKDFCFMYALVYGFETVKDAEFFHNAVKYNYGVRKPANWSSWGDCKIISSRRKASFARFYPLAATGTKGMDDMSDTRFIWPSYNFGQIMPEALKMGLKFNFGFIGPKEPSGKWLNDHGLSNTMYRRYRTARLNWAEDDTYPCTVIINKDVTKELNRQL